MASFRLRAALRPAALAGSVVLALTVAAPAAAAGPTRDTYEFDVVSPGVVQCDGFEDDFTDWYHIRETDIYDSDGTLVRVMLHIEHHSLDVNSVTGATLEEHARVVATQDRDGQSTEIDDFVSGTYTLTGARQVASLPHRGVVIQDTGRIVLDSSFDLTFVAGGRHRGSIWFGEQVWCDALS